MEHQYKRPESAKVKSYSLVFCPQLYYQKVVRLPLFVTTDAFLRAIVHSCIITFLIENVNKHTIFRTIFKALACEL